VGRCRGRKPALAQVTGERQQRRPVLFDLAVSGTVSGVERAMAVHVGKADSGAVARTRWPQLKVDAALPADAPARHGEDVFVTQCLPCHRLNGAGGSEIGPDLGQPMAATDYLTEAGIRALVRDPKSAARSPGQ